MCAAVKDAPHRPFNRGDVHCSLPHAVFHGVECISRIKVPSRFGGNGELIATSFDMADVRGDRKVLRFHLYGRGNEGALNSVSTLRFEFAWTPPSKSNRSIPSPAELALEKRNESSGNELQIEADIAALTNVVVTALRKKPGGTTVSLFRADSGLPYDIVAVRKVIDDLYLSGWSGEPEGPGAVVRSYCLHITPRDRGCY